jgi:hypothetical protein
MNNKMKKSAMVAVMAFAIGLLGTTLISIPSADALTVGNQRNSQGAAQQGIVNAAVGIQANVGAVCVQALTSASSQCD